MDTLSGIAWYVNYMSIKLQTRSGCEPGCLCLIIDHSGEERKTTLMNKFLRGSCGSGLLSPLRMAVEAITQNYPHGGRENRGCFCEYIVPSAANLST